MTRTCLDLFAGLGGFSQAFEEDDRWEAVTVEIEERFEPDICADILDLSPSDLPEADVVLASPPCVVFSFANVKVGEEGWEDKEPVGDRVAEHVGLVYHTLSLIHRLNPEWWFLENPKARLRWVLGPPTGSVTLCQYGRDVWKPTDLWGRHPPSMTYRGCRQGDSCHESNPGSWGKQGNTVKLGETPNDRAMIPHGLSEAILEAVEDPQPDPRRALEADW